MDPAGKDLGVGHADHPPPPSQTALSERPGGLEGELREPTAEELAEPWLVVEETDVSGEGEQPAIGGARVVRAVCTIEGMNSELGTVTVKDSRGKLHLIGGVEPEKMQGVKLGQTIVMVYTQAMALTLEKKADMATQ